MSAPGWKWVPEEPTPEMKIAGDNAGWWCADKYRAMLAAAPAAPAAPEAPEVEPVAVVEELNSLGGMMRIVRSLKEVPAGTLLYAHPPAASDADERAKFEAWCMDLGLGNLSRCTKGRYVDNEVYAYWAGWKAAKEQS